MADDQTSLAGSSGRSVVLIRRDGRVAIGIEVGDHGPVARRWYGQLGNLDHGLADVATGGNNGDVSECFAAEPADVLHVAWLEVGEQLGASDVHVDRHVGDAVQQHHRDVILGAGRTGGHGQECGGGGRCSYEELLHRVCPFGVFDRGPSPVEDIYGSQA